MNKIVKLVFMAAMVVTSSGYAGDHNIKVCAVQASDFGKYFIRPCGGWTSVNNCSGGWIVWRESSEASKAMYSAALTAFTTDATVLVRIIDGSLCDGYDVTSMIRLSK